jgi:argininosuccinate lyase
MSSTKQLSGDQKCALSHAGCRPSCMRAVLCRSRNDQVVTDYRLWLLSEIAKARTALQGLIQVACDRAESEADALMPGFTHLQPAQTVRWGHWMMCHATAWQRDDQRLRDMIPRVAQLPLAGNPFLVDRQFLAQVCPRPCHRTTCPQLPEAGYFHAA